MEELGFCAIINPDIPTQLTMHLIDKFRLFEVEDRGTKYSAVLFFSARPLGPEERDGYNLLASAQLAGIPTEIFDAYIEEPRAGFLLKADLSELAFDYIEKTFYVEEVEIDGSSRKVLRTTHIELKPVEVEKNGTGF